MWRRFLGALRSLQVCPPPSLVHENKILIEFATVTGAVATHLKNINDPRPFHKAMLIPMAGFICAWVYPVYVNFFNRETMDVRRETEVGLVPGPSEKELVLQQQASNVKGGEVRAVEEA